MNLDIAENLPFPTNLLTKHFIALGSSGSGKTVLCKKIIEQANKQNIPAIIIDLQGDLSSLDGNKVIYTPASSKGIPISINPIQLPDKNLQEEEKISILQQTTNTIVEYLNYPPNSDSEKSAKALIYLTLNKAVNSQVNISSFNHLKQLLEQTGEEKQNKKDLQSLIKKIEFLTIGENDLLFNHGIQLNIESLVKEPKINIFYLNTLKDIREKQFFIAALATKLYNHIIKNPSQKLNLIFYLDEIAEFIPAGNLKPISKQPLMLLFKQARKYGLGCIVATQNPGDIDYKAFAQFNTWALGRITQNQDIHKIQTALKSISRNTDVNLGSLPPGTFMLFSPDISDKPIRIQTKPLDSKHITLTERDIELQMDKIRHNFKETKLQQTEEIYQVMKKLSEPTEPVLHFPLTLDHSKLLKAIERYRKKPLFGKKEDLKNYELILYPLYIAVVKVNKSGLFKNKIEEHKLIFDAINGNLVRFDNTNYISFKGFKDFIELTTKEIDYLKFLNNKKPMSAHDIANQINDKPAISQAILSSLLKKKKINVIKENNTHLWQSMTEITAPLNINKASSFPQLQNTIPKAHTLQVKVTEENLTTLSAWFNALVIKHHIIYYPYYKIIYSSKKGERTVNLSAVDGKQFILHQ